MEVLVRDERVPRQRNVTAAYLCFFRIAFYPQMCVRFLVQLFGIWSPCRKSGKPVRGLLSHLQLAEKLFRLFPSFLVNRF